MAGLDRDALALLVVRLGSDRPSDGDLCWHPWDKAVGAAPDGLSEEASSSPHANAPFKRFPSGGADYFSPPVRQVLFPPSSKNSSRWVCCPDELYLDIGWRGKPGRTARVELLERLTAPIELGGSFGLIHLSLCPAEEANAPDVLSWNSAIRTTYLKANNPLEFALCHGDRETDLGRRPARGLAVELFGDPHDDLDRQLYAMTMASYPPEARNDLELQREWRWALAKRSYKLTPGGNVDPEREQRQTLHIVDVTGLVLNNCAVFTTSQQIDGNLARNFRSYWSESLVFGLLQQGCLEEFQRKEAEAGDSEVGSLHRDWLEFRRRVWRSQPAVSAEPPRELLALFRRARGAEELFAELEQGFASYEQPQHHAGDKQRPPVVEALGAALGVLAALATLIGLFNTSGRMLAALIVAAVVLSAAAALLVWKLLKQGRDRR